MKTRKRKPVAADIDSTPGNANVNSDAAPVDSTPESEREKPNRISFNVTPEGAPDWERMQPKTKTQLTEVLQNKAVQKELGISQEQAKQISEIGFGEDEANALLDLLGNIDSVAASKIYGIPGEITSQAFAFTPDHRKKINPPLARILNKWGPAMLKTWKDEIGLGIVFFSVLNSQVRIMHILEDKRKRNLPATSGPRSVTPISEPAASKPEEKIEVAKSGDILEDAGIHA
jgi:hypothetical protein